MGVSKRDVVMVAVLLTGTLLAVLNQTLLSPALPAIMADLDVGGRAGLSLHGTEEPRLLSLREVARLDGREHLHAPLVHEREQFGDEVGQAYEALHLVLAHPKLLGQNVARPPAVRLVRNLRTSEVGAPPLALHRLKAHRVRERPLARQDGLPLEIRVHHGDDGLVVAHIPHDARHALKPRKLSGALAAVPAHQLVALSARVRGTPSQGDGSLDS